MDVRYHDFDFFIVIEIPRKASNVLDQLAFIYILKVRFTGKMTDSRKRGKMLVFTIPFADYEKYDGAKYHCRRNLDSNGEILRDYLGALDAADPGRRMAEALQQEALDAN
jgi:hypothetical protein